MKYGKSVSIDNDALKDMTKIRYDIQNWQLAQDCSSTVLTGSAFAFVNPHTPNSFLEGLANLWGVSQEHFHRSILSLFPDGVTLPGVKLNPTKWSFQLKPILLTDKEIYRRAEDTVYLLLITPKWGLTLPKVANLTIKNNGMIYRTQKVALSDKGLTLVPLSQLPEGNYQVSLNGQKKGCQFSVVEYSLSPFEVTLKQFQLENNILTCELNIKQYNEPFKQPVNIRLVSGSISLDRQTVKPVSEGVYQTNLQIKTESSERLELHITYQDLSASVLIPGSRKIEREETTICALGKEVNISLMPHPDARLIRGMYLRENDTINNSPVAIIDPAPENRQAQLQWRTDCEDSKLLLLDLAGNVIEERALGAIKAGEMTEIPVTPPACILVIGAWIGDQAWEGWSILMTSGQGELIINTPKNARPSEDITLTLNSSYPASIYLSIKDNRLMRSDPKTRLAANLKEGFATITKWGTSGYVKETIKEELDRNPPHRVPIAGMSMAGRSQNQSPINRIRRDFSDVVYCGILETDNQGNTSLTVTLPDTVTTYNVEAFALSENQQEWCQHQVTLDVFKPIWAEFQIPSYIYPTDKSIGVINVGCNSSQFRLKLFCNGEAVAYQIAGENKTSEDVITGNLVKVEFEAMAGQWRVEVEDQTTGDMDISEKFIAALGSFKSLARRFQLLMNGESLKRSEIEALQLRLLPSLDKPFNLLCDATTNYEHRCCEQTAAKLISAIASLLAGGDQDKLIPVILAGIQREISMYRPNQGLALYPDDSQANDYWGKIAAQHLLSLSMLEESLSQLNNFELKPSLSQLFDISKETTRIYNLSLIPQSIDNGQDAYRGIKLITDLEQSALNYARQTLEKLSNNPKNGQEKVLKRQEMAYCAATLLVGNDLNDLKLAIATANELANSLDSHGRLYSTVDSVAMIALMSELKAKGITTGTAKIEINDTEMSLQEGLDYHKTIETIKVIEGCAVVEVTYEIIEDWSQFTAKIPVKVQLKPKYKSFELNQGYQKGDSLELIVTLNNYEDGLLLNVCLPPCLSRLQGGGEVKRFSVDFAGEKSLTIPLQVTQKTLPQGENWAILVRNMFKEEDAGNPGLLHFQVKS